MTTNKEIIQSYLFTITRNNFTVYEKRIMYKIVESLQYQLQGQTIKTFKKIENSDYKEITIIIKDMLLSEKDKNHTQLKQALKSLSNRTYDKETNNINNSNDKNNTKNWELIRLIDRPKIIKGEIMQFEIHEDVFNLIFEFAKGYRQFELKTVLSLKSTYSMRLYELISKQTKPITRSIEDLKYMFELENKYKKNNDFIKRIIEPAKQELDQKSPYSFEWKPNEGRTITHITIIPKKIIKNQDEKLEEKRLSKMINPSILISKEITKTLKEYYDFTEQEIKNNLPFLKECTTHLDLQNKLSELKRRAETEPKTTKQRWVIGILKKELTNYKKKLQKQQLQKLEELPKEQLNEQQQLLINLNSKYKIK